MLNLRPSFILSLLALSLVGTLTACAPPPQQQVGDEPGVFQEPAATEDRPAATETEQESTAPRGREQADDGMFQDETSPGQPGGAE
jgi:hypothetical protein